MITFSLGLIAIPVVIDLIVTKRLVDKGSEGTAANAGAGQVIQGIRQAFQHWRTIMTNSVLAVWLGIIPGTGGSTTHVWRTTLLLTAIGFLHTAVWPVIVAWGLEIPPPNLSGSFISLLFMTQSGFGASSPLLDGLIADSWNLSYSMYVLADASVLSYLMVFVVYLAVHKPA